MHEPDLVVATTDRRAGHIEVETTRKDQRRYVELLKGFARSVATDWIDEVVYLVPSGNPARRQRLEVMLAKAAARARTSLEAGAGLTGAPVPQPRLETRWWSVEEVDFEWDVPLRGASGTGR